MKLSDPRLSVVRRLLITDSTSLLVIGLFRFPISSLFSLGRLHISKNFFSFLLGFLVCCIIVHSSSLWCLVFLCYQFNVSSFICKFISLVLSGYFVNFSLFTNNTAINIFLHVFLWKCGKISLGFFLRYIIAGL